MKNTLSALLDRVRAGESVVIEDRGIPVARLAPLASTGEPEGRRARLERAGRVRAARGPAPRAVLARRPPKPRPGATASALVVAERRGDR